VERLVAQSGCAAVWISHDPTQLARVARDAQLEFRPGGGMELMRDE
jgi:ABC-type iron transport system FetAB ATPase subunit